MAKTSKLPEHFTIDSDGAVRLTGELFQRWKAADLSLENTNLKLKLKNKEIDEVLAKHPEVKKLLDERTALIHGMTGPQNELREVHSMIESSLNVQIKDVSIDDNSGRVFVHTPTGSEPLIRKRSRSKRSR